MEDSTQQTPETDAEKIAAMKEFEKHCTPMHFTEECLDDDDNVDMKSINRDLNVMFAECFARILIKKTAHAT